MITMKRIVSLLAAVALCATAFAQPAPQTFVRGELGIKYNTRTQTDSDGKPRAGIPDVYTLSVNVSNSAVFRGTIEYCPYIKGFIGSAQSPKLIYAVEADVVNPANPAQTRNIGRLHGEAPIDENNVYRFADGNVVMTIFGMGAAKGFDSKMVGLAAGKPPANTSLFNRIKKDALNLQRKVQGKTVAISVTEYDKMEFQQHVLPAGPVAIYPEASVTGPMIYDYNRTAWLLDGITVSYAVDGRQLHDRISGSIRWIEAPNRRVSGLGEYQFDIRVNEPPPTESSIFAGAADEASFFAQDSSIPSLTGTMKYKDTIAGDKVTASAIQIELVGNQLSKQQVMYLAKLLMLSAVVPLNAE